MTRYGIKFRSHSGMIPVNTNKQRWLLDLWTQQPKEFESRKKAAAYGKLNLACKMSGVGGGRIYAMFDVLPLEK